MRAQLIVEPRVGATPKGPSPSSRFAAEVVRRFARPLVQITGIAPHLAPALDVIAQWRGLPEGVSVEELKTAEFRAEIVRPESPEQSLLDGVVLYVHGGNLFGGDFAGSGFSTHRTLVANLAKRCGLAVMSVDYRRSEGPGMTRSIDDCTAAYTWLLEHGVPADQIVVAGDASGAYLAFSTVMRATVTGLPVPAGLVGISGIFNTDAPGHFLNVPGILALNGPVRALPPTLLISADDEHLRADSDWMAKRLSDAGVRTKLQVWHGQIHSFVSTFPNLPESQLAISDIARFVISKMAVAAAERQTA